VTCSKGGAVTAACGSVSQIQHGARLIARQLESIYNMTQARLGRLHLLQSCHLYVEAVGRYIAVTPQGIVSGKHAIADCSACQHA
jgi:hypothetical protein